ncbi:MAG: amidohydrolase family protein [Actinomycetales bacterium]|nr:amidohydrolase family protein [Leifsonia sp.]
MTLRIDAHVHLWARALDPQDWIDPETMAGIDRDFDTGDLGGMLRATNMDRAVVVQATNSLDESVRLARSDPAVVAGLVAWVDLAGDVHAQLDRVREQATVPVVGVRHLSHMDPNPEWLLREDVGRGFGTLEQEGLTFDLVIRDRQLSQAARLAGRHTGLRFVVDHLGGAPAPGADMTAWASGFRSLAEHANVVAKVSGLSSGLAPGAWTARDLAPVIDEAFGVFGPGRLLYGSDWPLAELGGGSPAWKAALESFLGELSAGEIDELYGGTAARVYSLSLS